MITPLLPTFLVRQLAHRHPHFRTARICVRLRHDADYVVALPVERDRLVQNARLPAEASLPQRVTQHDDRPAAWFVFFVCVQAAVKRVDAQRGEEISRALACDDSFRFACAREVVTAAIADADLFKRLRLHAPVAEVRIRDRHLVHYWTLFVEEYETLRFCVRDRKST